MKATRSTRCTAPGLASRRTTPRYSERIGRLCLVTPGSTLALFSYFPLPGGFRAGGIWPDSSPPNRSCPTVISADGAGKKTSKRPRCGDQPEKRYCICAVGKQFTDGRMPKTGTLCTGCNTRRCPGCDGHINQRWHTHDHCADGQRYEPDVLRILHNPARQHEKVPCSWCPFQLVGAHLPGDPKPESIGLPKKALIVS